MLDSKYVATQRAQAIPYPMSASAKLETADFHQTNLPVTDFVAFMHIDHGYTPANLCRMVVRGYSQKSRISGQ
jgi:hypothetical protein